MAIQYKDLPIELQWAEDQKVRRQEDIADWLTALFCGTVALIVCVPKLNAIADKLIGLEPSGSANSSKPNKVTSELSVPNQPFTGKLTKNQTKPIIAFMKVGSSYTNGRVYFPCVRADRSDCTVHPITKRISSHRGVDLVSPYGQPNLAVGIRGQGKVTVTCKKQVNKYGELIGGGNYAEMYQKSTGADTITMHLSRCVFPLNKPVDVEPGTVVGYTGSTGSSTGPHIHFSQFINGKSVNPQLWAAVMLIDGKLPPP